MEAIFRLYRWAEKYRKEIILSFSAISFLMGFVIYWRIYELNFLDAISYTVGLFAMDVKTPSEIVDIAIKINNIDSSWRYIFVASIFAKITVILSVFLLFFRSLLSTWYRNRVISNGGHTIVVGLGRNSRFFINSMLEHEKHKMIVFEKDSKSDYLEEYRNKRLSLVEDDVMVYINRLNINNAENIFISTGNDETNIYIAMKFMALIDKDNRSIKKFVVHIEDRTLRNLYADDKALYKEHIDLQTFSFYQESAQQLFREHLIEGDDCSIMRESEPFNILIVGNSELSISLISEACRLSNLPNENRLTIYCMGRDIKELEKNVLYSFPKIDSLRDVKIEYIEADNRCLEFYEHPVWQTDNLTHIIYADNCVTENIRISTKVSDVTYVRNDENVLKTKFHIATMNHIRIAEEINKEFKDKNVFTFAQADKICSRKNLLFNETDEIAKMIHYAYTSEHFKTNNSKMVKEVVDKTWKDATVNDKRTSLAQAIHIDTKLKYLGLKCKKVIDNVNLFQEKNLFCIYKKNIRVLNKKLEKDKALFGLTKQKLNEMEKAYRNRDNGVDDGYFFPEKYKTKFEKLLRMEHNRWMTILILMDNILDDKAKSMEQKERKLKKMHHLLKPFEEFNTNEEKIYIIDDSNC